MPLRYCISGGCRPVNAFAWKHGANIGIETWAPLPSGGQPTEVTLPDFLDRQRREEGAASAGWPFSRSSRAASRAAGGFGTRCALGRGDGRRAAGLGRKLRLRS